MVALGVDLECVCVCVCEKPGALRKAGKGCPEVGTARCGLVRHALVVFDEGAMRVR